LSQDVCLDALEVLENSLAEKVDEATLKLRKRNGDGSIEKVLHLDPDRRLRRVGELRHRVLEDALPLV